MKVSFKVPAAEAWGYGIKSLGFDITKSEHVESFRRGSYKYTRMEPLEIQYVDTSSVYNTVYQQMKSKYKEAFMIFIERLQEPPNLDQMLIALEQDQREVLDALSWVVLFEVFKVTGDVVPIGALNYYPELDILGFPSQYENQTAVGVIDLREIFSKSKPMTDEMRFHLQQALMTLSMSEHPFSGDALDELYQKFGIKKRGKAGVDILEDLPVLVYLQAAFGKRKIEKGEGSPADEFLRSLGNDKSSLFWSPAKVHGLALLLWSVSGFSNMMTVSPPPDRVRAGDVAGSEDADAYATRFDFAWASGEGEDARRCGSESDPFVQASILAHLSGGPAVCLFTEKKDDEGKIISVERYFSETEPLLATTSVQLAQMSCIRRDTTVKEAEEAKKRVAREWEGGSFREWFEKKSRTYKKIPGYDLVAVESEIDSPIAMLFSAWEEREEKKPISPLAITYTRTAPLGLRKPGADTRYMVQEIALKMVDMAATSPPLPGILSPKEEKEKGKGKGKEGEGDKDELKNLQIEGGELLQAGPWEDATVLKQAFLSQYDELKGEGQRLSSSTGREGPPSDLWKVVIGRELGIKKPLSQGLAKDVIKTIIKVREDTKATETLIAPTTAFLTACRNLAKLKGQILLFMKRQLPTATG